MQDAKYSRQCNQLLRAVQLSSNSVKLNVCILPRGIFVFLWWSTGAVAFNGNESDGNDGNDSRGKTLR